MIIPIRCFTCNKVIADKWEPFVDIATKNKSIFLSLILVFTLLTLVRYSLFENNISFPK